MSKRKRLKKRNKIRTSSSKPTMKMAKKAAKSQEQREFLECLKRLKTCDINDEETIWMINYLEVKLTSSIVPYEDLEKDMTMIYRMVYGKEVPEKSIESNPEIMKKISENIMLTMNYGYGIPPKHFIDVFYLRYYLDGYYYCIFSYEEQEQEQDLLNNLHERNSAFEDRIEECIRMINGKEAFPFSVVPFDSEELIGMIISKEEFSFDMDVVFPKYRLN